MRCMSWNVNGLRACLGKGFLDFIRQNEPDILCLQETKMQQGQVEIDLPGYYEFWNSAEKKGYSGTAIFTKHEPVSVRYGLGIDEHDHEGRVICLEYPEFYMVDVYTPNSQRELTRLEYRMRWEDDFRIYLAALDRHKPVLVCGDMNVAHQEIDLKNPKSNAGNAGFTPQEREKMTLLQQAGFADTFRRLHPETVAYSWWSYMGRAREKNVGWRIDYFLVSERILSRVTAAGILPEVMGSDHCPVEIEAEIDF